MTVSRYKELFSIYRTNTTVDITETENKALIMEVQRVLNEKGFNAGEVDGIAGPKTLKALEQAKDYLSLQYPTLLGKTTIKMLIDMVPRKAFFKPTDGVGVLTSPFGWRTHPVHGGRRFHRGVDIGAARGTKVYAIANGQVRSITGHCKGDNNSCGGGYGNHVRIAHPGNADFDETLYAHLDNVFVRQEQIVKAGDFLGTLGSTGWSTGPHLHFETRKDGKALNPIDLIEVI